MLGYARMMNQVRGDFEENPLKVGETVRLGSGGPRLTVSSRDDGMVGVSWFDRNGQVHTQLVEAELLRRARKSFFASWR